MTQVTAVDAYWLGAWDQCTSVDLDADISFFTAELGSVFYSVKEKNFDERGNRRTADREFSKRAELETEMARQREEFAKKALEEAVAAKTASGSSSKIIVPGTPRHTGGSGVTGIGAGARVTQTPRRRVGI